MVSKLGQLAKTFVVLLCLVSWLEMSNHCALAALKNHRSEPETCCSKNDKKPSAKDTRMVCCQKLQTIEQAQFLVPAIPVALLADDLHTFLNFITPTLSEQQNADIRIGDPPPSELASQLDSERCHPAFAPPLFC